MANLFDIGRSGLNSYRQGLAITGQNIANINTDGYKRRGAELEELSAAKASVLESSQGSGMGVRIGTIRRAFDEFLLNKARSALPTRVDLGICLRGVPNREYPASRRCEPWQRNRQVLRSLQEIASDPPT